MVSEVKSGSHVQAIIGNYAVPILEDKQVWGTSDDTRTAYLDSQDVARMALAALRYILYFTACFVCYVLLRWIRGTFGCAAAMTLHSTRASILVAGEEGYGVSAHLCIAASHLVE